MSRQRTDPPRIAVSVTGRSGRHPQVAYRDPDGGLLHSEPRGCRDEVPRTWHVTPPAPWHGPCCETCFPPDREAECYHCRLRPPTPQAQRAAAEWTARQRQEATTT